MENRNREKTETGTNRTIAAQAPHKQEFYSYCKYLLFKHSNIPR